jgi:hypothetical protein
VTADYLTGEALDTLLRTGDVPLNEGGDRGVVTRHAKALGGVGPLHTWGRLFLTMPEAAALSVLLVCDQGWNRSVLDAMTVPDDMPGAGEDSLDIYRVPVPSAAARPAPGTRPRTWSTPGPEHGPDPRAGARPAMPGRSQTLASQAGGWPCPRLARAADPR